MLSTSLLNLFVVLGLSTSAGVADDKKGDAQPPAPSAPEAPVPELLRGVLDNLFGPKNNGERPRQRRGATPGGADNDVNGGARDPVESRAPRDAKVEQLLQAADTAIKQKNLKSAVDLYQRLLDQPEDSLHRLSNGQWRSVRQTVNLKLGQLPDATLIEYRSQFGGLARQLLLMAQRSGRTIDFVQVATRFFHTVSGYEAAQYLASRHFDRSEFGLAARWYSELASSPAAFTRQDSWLLQAAAALNQVGDVKGANAFLSRLSQGPATVVSLGTGPVKASEWLSQTQVESQLPVKVLANWTQLYGTAARVGTAEGGDALLSPNWTIPSTSSPAIRNTVKWLVHDLQDQQRSLILAAQPRVIDGNVIYRDLRGLRSVEIETGHLQWEGVEGVSPERILGGLPSQQIDPQEAWRFPANQFPNMGDYQGQSVEYSPLASLLFRDGTYGLISSDGKRVFVIEDHGILSTKQPGGERWGWDGNSEPHDLFGVPWKTNRLVAYDLKTGRVSWSLGGSESRESFDLPFAGFYFYGTPVVDGNELYLVAGKGDDIRLWSLDCQTGVPQWSQLIAYSDTKIDLDLVRRLNTSQVAVGSGVIVCPTTVGWLVAIDQMRQSVLWAYRYTPQISSANPPDREAGTQFLAQKELNAQWCPSAPVISGNYVVLTPQDEPRLICLNVVDGQRIWDRPKETGIYLAGVFDQKVLIVGETGVSAIKLSDGNTLWTTKFDDGIRASGRGVVVGDRFYLPLSNGELQSISLGAGQIMSQSYVGLRQPSLGNLAMHRGKLVSLNPTGITVFGQRDAVLTEIQQRLARDPNDPGALLRSSEIQLLNRKYADALVLLRQIAFDRLAPAEQVRQHVALIECLSTLIHDDILNRNSELEELGRLATSPAERLLHRELTAEKLLTEHKPVEAFDVFSTLAEEAGDTFVVRAEDRHISVKRTAWLSGRMSEIWSETPESDRPSIDERIAALVANAADRDADSCQRIAALFAFHPASIAARERFAEWLIQSEDVSGARIVLQGLFEHSDKAVAARATDRLARLMIESHLPLDAVYYYQLLDSKFAKTVVRGEQTGAMIAAEARVAEQLDFTPQLKGIPWKASPLRIEQTVMNYTPPPQEVVYERELPFFNRLGLEFYQNDQRLSMESITTGQIDWMVPLRGAIRFSDESHLSTSLIGHQLYFVNRGILHAVSPIEKKVLWTKSVDDAFDGNMHSRHEGRSPIAPMIAPVQDQVTQSLLLQQSYSTGQLTVVQPNYLCLQGRRSLTILDPRTGSELWRLDGLSMNSQVVGNDDTLFVVVPGKNEALAYRASDGKPLELPGLAKILNSALLTQGSSLLLFQQGGPTSAGSQASKRLRTMKCHLSLYNPVSKSTKWDQVFPTGTVVSRLGQREIIALQPDWQLRRIDVETGNTMAIEVPVAETILSQKSGHPFEKYLLADDDRIYLIVNRLENDYQTFGESLASIRVNRGWIFAWNRQDNRFLWQHAVKDQNLVVDRFSNLPVLLFVSRTMRHRRRVNMDIGLLMVTAIHKETGQLLIDTKIPAAFSGFNNLCINMEEKSIELKSYNVRLRILPAADSVSKQTE